MQLNISNFQPYYSGINLPNGYRDSITGEIFEYDTGDAAGRETALRALRAAQITAIGTLISGGLIAPNDIEDLNKLKRAYAASQE